MLFIFNIYKYKHFVSHYSTLQIKNLLQLIMRIHIVCVGKKETKKENKILKLRYTGYAA